MLDPKDVGPINKENILRKIDEISLFKYYIGNFKKINVPFSSEIRKDDNPSCIISDRGNRIIYHDFSTGDRLDIFSYLMKKYQCTYSEVLNIINSDFNLSKGKPIKALPLLIGKEGEVEKSIFYKSRDCTKEDYDYWLQFGITKEILELYWIKPLSYFWINGDMFKCDNNTYLMPELKKGKWKYKIYSPFSDRRFISNDGGCIYGLRQLPESGDLLFITSSKKDVMTLRGLGYYSVAPTSETVRISEEVINYLKERWKRIYVFYDFDETGIKQSKLLKDTWELDGIIFTNDILSKDPSDYYKNNGKENLIKIIENEIKSKTD